jgi:AcrR family transcriptional regulator
LSTLNLMTDSSQSTSSQSTPIWRIPQQARSWKRFHDILDAAADLFAAIGYESVTTDDIAASANTSVGGLYRFFPDKVAVFHALLDRYLNQLRELSAALHTTEALQLPLDVYITQLVDEFDRFVGENPGFRTVFVQSRLISTTVAMNEAFCRDLAQQFTVYLAARNPALEQSDRELIATVSVEVACTLDILAVSRDRTFQQQVLGETKKLLIAYLRQYFPD